MIRNREWKKGRSVTIGILRIGQSSSSDAGRGGDGDGGDEELGAVGCAKSGAVWAYAFLSFFRCVESLYRDKGANRQSGVIGTHVGRNDTPGDSAVN
jgi:hypothetical protein